VVFARVVIQQANLNAMGPEKVEVPGKILILTDDNVANAKLKDGARAHHAGTERRIERNAVIP
jgi:hypothetical protein